MKSDSLEKLRMQAIDAGLLPSDAVRVFSDRPWPIVLFNAAGAWMAVVPFVLLMLSLFDSRHSDNLNFLTGSALLVTGLVLFHRKWQTLFWEQLAAPIVITGYVLLTMVILRINAGGFLAIFLSLILSCALAFLLPRCWLLLPLGFIIVWRAIGLLDWMIGFFDIYDNKYFLIVIFQQLSIGLQLSAWMAVSRLQKRSSWLRSGWSSILEWLLWGGTAAMLFRLGFGHLGFFDLFYLQPDDWLSSVFSLLWLLFAMVLLLSAWPRLRHPLAGAALIPLMLLAWWIPDFGVTLAVAALCAVTHRWALLAIPACFAIGQIGISYYDLGWPLVVKAQVMAGSGLLLALVCWLGYRKMHPATLGGKNVETTENTGRHSGWALGLVAASLLMTLATVNAGIWQKETLIADGRSIYIALAPVDPRSLMQGDYMRLNFALPSEISSSPVKSHGLAVARVDGRGVAVVERWHAKDVGLAADEVLIELVERNAQWTVVTDAWFFKEGEGDRWQAARFGVFRLAPDGRALLVDLADADLQPVGIKPH